MDGFETARLIHEHPRFERTPIIFVTGVHVSELDRVKGYKLGAVDYVQIPIVPEILRGKVDGTGRALLQASRAANAQSQSRRGKFPALRGQYGARGGKDARAHRAQRDFEASQCRARGSQQRFADRDRRASAGRARAEGGGPAQGRVSGDARPRAAQSACTDPQCRADHAREAVAGSAAGLDPRCHRAPAQSSDAPGR